MYLEKVLLCSIDRVWWSGALPFLPLALPGALPALNGTFGVDLPSALHSDTAP